MNSTDFAIKLLNEKKVAIAPGETFGEMTNSFIRVSFSTDTDMLIKGTHILCDWIKQNTQGVFIQKNNYND